jgi:DivIVA domain-containing protein
MADPPWKVGRGWVDSPLMDNSQASSSILDTLRTVEFRLGLKGYNVDEVDEYLDKAAQEAEGLQEHVRQLNERLRQASERIAALEREKRSAPAAAEGEDGAAAASGDAALSDETLQRTLLLAQKFVDQTKRESEAEAAAVVSQAEESARATVAAAEQTAAQLQAESNQKVREEVARLEATRTELATDVENMARHLESERNRLRGALSEILKWVDDNVQPANSLMGVKSKADKGEKGDKGDKRAADAPGTSETAGVGDGGAPTLNLQNVFGATASGGPHSL